MWWCIPLGNMSYTTDATFLKFAKVRLFLLDCRVKFSASQQRFPARLLVASHCVLAGTWGFFFHFGFNAFNDRQIREKRRDCAINNNGKTTDKKPRDKNDRHARPIGRPDESGDDQSYTGRTRRGRTNGWP